MMHDPVSYGDAANSRHGPFGSMASAALKWVIRAERPSNWHWAANSIEALQERCAQAAVIAEDEVFPSGRFVMRKYDFVNFHERDPLANIRRRILCFPLDR